MKDAAAVAAVGAVTAVNIKETEAYRKRWLTMIVIGLGGLFTALHGSMFSLALAEIQSTLHATSIELKWMTTIYTMVLAGAVLTVGVLSDRLGRAMFFRLGIVIWMVGVVIALLSNTPLELIFAQATMGFAACYILTTHISILTNIFPPEERAKGVAVIAALQGVGIAMGPIIAGSILEHHSYRWMFAIYIPMAAVTLGLSLFFLKEFKSEVTRKTDLPGNMLLIGAIATALYGLNMQSKYGWSSPNVRFTLIGAGVALFLFALWEFRTKMPLLDLRLFKIRQFTASILSLAFWATGFYFVMYILSFYMKFVKGYGPIDVGVRYLGLGLGYVLGSQLSSRVFIRRFGIKPTLLGGFLGAAVMFLFLGSLTARTDVSKIEPILFFLGLFIGSIIAPTMNALLGSLPVSKGGTAGGMNQVTLYLFGSISVAMFGSFLTNIYSSHFTHAAASQPWPASLVDKAKDSVGVAVGTAQSGKIPAAWVNPLTSIARGSFLDAWQAIAIILAIMFFVGAFLIYVLMPHQDKSITGGGGH
jgi:EmrB/QacA subfamily drug resistance transporter